MQKEKEQQKPREELTLVFFPSSSLMLHSEGGREGGCKTEKREKKNGRRGWREEGSSTLHLLLIRFSPCLKVFMYSVFSVFFSFSFVSFTHSSFLSSLFIPFSFPQATYHIHSPYVSPLYALPIPSLVTFSPSSTSLP